MSYKRKILYILFLSVGIVGCISSLYMPNQSDATSQNTSLEKLRQGRELYINNCGSCHTLHLPSGYTKQQWTPILDRMQKKAHIDDSQKELIARYLKTNCKQ